MSTVCELAKGTQIQKMGEYGTHLSILWSGICRGYLEDENGQDTTDCFAMKRGSVLWGCGPLNEPSVIGVEALTDCRVIQMPMEPLLKLAEHCEGMRILNKCLTQALEMHWNMRQNLCQGDAMKRYRWFLEEYPGLVDQVNKRHIASFLRMTPVSLSRLRKKLREDDSED